MPCSAVMIAASSSLRALSSSRNANRIVVRLAIEVSRQAGKAARAASMTARASATSASATCPVTWPVAGLVTAAVRSLLPAKFLPPAQWAMVRTRVWGAARVMASILVSLRACSDGADRHV